MAVVAVAVGKVTVNTPDAFGTLEPPKFKTATAAPVVLLYIRAPAAVKLADAQDVLLNEIYAVLDAISPTGICDTVSILPPAVYPAPTTSLFVVYVVVELSRVARPVYKAILYT